MKQIARAEDDTHDTVEQKRKQYLTNKKISVII